MFEKTIKPSDSLESQESDVLRPIEWPALTARFDAGRMLRRKTGHETTLLAGSFSALSQEDCLSVNKKTADVNPTHLEHGKAVTAQVLESAGRRKCQIESNDD